jgi:trehalose 6-phosphate synthase
MAQRLIVASNRGPVSWKRTDDGGPEPRRGFGGLVTALGGALQSEPGTWVSVALSETDREVASSHQGEPFEVDADGFGFRLRLLDAGERYDPYYNEVANRLLWFTLHQLWGDPYEPSGEGWRDAWEAYVGVNSQIARAVVDAASDSDAEVYLQDYHLCCAGPVVRETLPEVPILHYLHTPWVEPSYLRRLPDTVAEEVLRGLLAADVVAVSSPMWRDAFRRCAVEVVGARPDTDGVVLDGRRTVIADFVLGVDLDDLEASARSEEAVAAGALLDDELGERQLILRVDRTDLSKNILRGLRAYGLLLDRHPELRGRVWHYAHLNPSRQDVAEYRAYLDACRQEADRLRERFGDDAVELYVGDDYPRAVAALQRSDVLLTNPVMDGTNLVAKEGPVLNRNDGVVVLSRAAGAAAMLDEGALLVNPYDVEAQAAALHRALTMDPDERAARAGRLRAAARRGAPAEWFDAQRSALRSAVRGRPRRP